MGQGNALALPVLQEGHGSEGQLPDREVAQPQVRESTAFPAARPTCPKHLPIPLFLSPAHLAMGQILEIFHVARVLQSGHMRKAPSWPRSLPCEQNVPILGGTVLNQLIWPTQPIPLPPAPATHGVLVPMAIRSEIKTRVPTRAAGRLAARLCKSLKR